MKLIYKLLSLLFVSVAVQSCSLMGSIDDIKPQHVVDDETVIVDASTAQFALNGVYSSVRSYDVCIFRACMSVWAGTYENTDTSGSKEFMGDSQKKTAIKIENTGVESVYRGYYYVINTVNSFIDNLNTSNPSDLSDARKIEMLGEARCMRALINIHLLRLFGEYYDNSSEYGIVLYEKPVRANEPKARSKVSDCYKLILDDLEFASTYAPAYQYEHSFLSALVAKALMARVYLTKGDYAEAAKWAGKVIDEAEGSGYGLEENFTSVFTTQFNSPEMLFAPYVNKATSELVSSSWKSTKAGRLLTTLGNTMGANGELDPRYQATYEGINNINKTAKYPLILDGYSDVNSYYFMRLPEVYYIKAEAEARLGNYDAARELMRPLCDRAGYAEDYVDRIADADVLGMVLKNKLMELSVENGEEWFDLVRYHQKGGFESWSATEKAQLPAFNQILLPIPRTAMAGNTLLVQNPEYQSL